ncbi:hypothetical protein PIB30_020717 [Stylosanthes scabra]|uniref:Uncharacterized protein n=1 Tax=Stylosanthes scabra TaxID=79078 RepID=A0ABU6YAI7_9FABA|nr:hypothetical protein [Stylosanthes scabra]
MADDCYPNGQDVQRQRDSRWTTHRCQQETCILVWPDLNIGAATKLFLALIWAVGFVLWFKLVSVSIKETGYRDSEQESRWKREPKVLKVSPEPERILPAWRQWS